MLSNKMVNQNRFARIEGPQLSRSVFDRSHRHKTTFNAGLLIPVFVDEALPGDTLNVRMHTFCRMATAQFPIMDNVYLDSFFFAVPKRLLWEHWQNFMGEKDNPSDSTTYTVPQLEVAGGSLAGAKKMADYFGLPTQGTTYEVSALPFRAYNRIYDDWFRDQNLIDQPVLDVGDANSNESDHVLRRRGKRHDFFTSALPWPQKGDAVELPLGTSAPLTITGNGQPTFDHGTATDSRLDNAGAQNLDTEKDGGVLGGYLSWNTPALTGTADLSSATAATINQWRQALAIQGLLERDARGGTRYTEILRAHFGVVSPDQRLQRSEYLGGGSQVINYHPVAATNQSANVDLGDLAAYATSQGSNHGFVKSFTEHCVVIGLVCIRADMNYYQGINRMWLRQTKYDFYWPGLSNIGEQVVEQRELWMANDSTDTDVFGYQERWAEYKYKPSLVTGEFRPNYSFPLDAWHLAQEYGMKPTLNQTFIEENPPMDRVQATNGQHMLFDSVFDYKATRPMPAYSTPSSLMGRF